MSHQIPCERDGSRSQVCKKGQKCAPGHPKAQKTCHGNPVDDMIKARLHIIRTPAHRQSKDKQQIPCKVLTESQGTGSVFLPASVLAGGNEFEVLALAHHVLSHLFGVDVGAHKLDGSHQVDSELARLLFNGKVHEVVPLGGSQSRLVRDSPNGRITL
jgi:hypothetical protein